jgi:hypothetical protein
MVKVDKSSVTLIDTIVDNCHWHEVSCLRMGGVDVMGWGTTFEQLAGQNICRDRNFVTELAEYTTACVDPDREMGTTNVHVSTAHCWSRDRFQ